MMLYVFHVDVGRMMNFDMSVALSSVENLKDTIERLHGIPAANIVLLVSGGEMLTQSTQVSYYSAGTDTNPIYMFLTGEGKLPPPISQMEPDLDLREQVDRSLELPAVYDTVVTRAQIALRMYDLARDEERYCERLVHEQHLQQQGWSAVVANMEDLTDEFRQRVCNFCSAFDRHLGKRSQDLELLRNFKDDRKKLAQIPILPGLMPLAEEDFHGFDEFLDTDEVFSRSQAQQESVLMAGGETGAVASEQQPLEDAATATTSSTSPNKKQKMGNESSDVEQRGGATALTSQSSNTSSCTRRITNLNLLQWITSKENDNTLELMSDECAQGLDAFTAKVYEQLKTEVHNIIKLADQSDVKEIKGLSERLCRLEEFKYKIKNMVQDQKELSTAFQQNQNRAINLRDASILPDLCASHKSQLVVMLQNHQKIRDHRRCIAKAKDELGTNLHTRLKRIVLLENAMSDFDSRLLFYHRCLRRAERHITIIDQIHQAPCMYVAAVTEVVRRKIFSGEFRQWASKLAEDFDIIHNEEITRRQQFNANFEGHFLNILFPGMNDMPPAFANENPLVFDTRLPNITKSDIDMLSSHLPDLAPQIQLPNMEPVINFFVSHSGHHQRERMEELIKQQVVEALSMGIAAIGGGEKTPQPQHQRLSELQKETATSGGSVGGGCDESETDTETEFEKVPPASVQTIATSTSENQPQQPDTIARSTTTERLLMQSAETLTEENESSARAEVERLRGILGSMSKLSADCVRLARANLENFRTDTETYREDLQSELQALNDKWNVVRMQCDEREQELQTASSERECELQVLRETLREREEMLGQHANAAGTLQEKCDALESQFEALRDQLKVAQLETASAVSAAREELIHEHKTEIESLRCRFKLMTSMGELSPSDSNLERLTPGGGAASGTDHNVIELAQHEAMLEQLRSDCDEEKEKAITAAVEMERSLWQSKIFPLNSESVMGNVSMLKEMLEEKERQLELMRQRDLMVTKENIQLMTRLDALTQDDNNSWLKEKIEFLNRDKCRLEDELTVEKSKRVQMESSFAALRGSTYEQPSTSRARTSGSSSSHKYAVLDACAKGDIVFVVWSMRHGQFMVVQDSQSLYFVHGDSLAALNLRLPQPPMEGATDELPIPMPYYAIGRVTEKEYCQARKDENRYRVTRGSKFYRIKLVPLTSKVVTRRERLESFSSSISHSTSQCESHSESFATADGSMAATAGGSASTPMRQSHSMGGGVSSMPTRDVLDYSGAGIATSPTFTRALGGRDFKERTISFSSVTAEDDEPVSLLSERCRYISVSEEEENVAAAQMTSTLQPQQQQIQPQQSVITEQPTSSSKLKLDLLLASADLTQSEATTATSPTTIALSTTPTTAAAIDEDGAITITAPTPSSVVIPMPAAAALILPTADGAMDTCSPSIPTSVGTTSEDSDEYRSLEGKDDTDFVISE